MSIEKKSLTYSFEVDSLCKVTSKLELTDQFLKKYKTLGNVNLDVSAPKRKANNSRPLYFSSHNICSLAKLHEIAGTKNNVQNEE